MNFTKGEWKVTNKNEGGFDGVFVSDNTGNILATISGTPFCTKEYKANAHLIAAAPDMYQALKLCLDVLLQFNIPEVLDPVEQALAKAKGK